VMPKLNWSAPKDASWINAGSLKCQTPGDVYLLLQSSDFVSHDVHHALADVDAVSAAAAPPPSTTTGSVGVFEGYKLALRKWCHLYPSHEFRCFVRNRNVVAVSQRHSTSHFPHLVEQQDEIRKRLVEFHDEHVKNRFAVDRQGGDPVVLNYVLDAYVDRNEKVWVVDFNVWGSRTDPLLFTWEELRGMRGKGGKGGDDVAAVTMRVVEAARQVRHNPLASYRAPIDAVHVASLTGDGASSGGPRAFEEFAKLCRRPQDQSSSSSSDDEDDV
jgi:D123